MHLYVFSETFLILPNLNRHFIFTPSARDGRWVVIQEYGICMV